MTKHPTTLMDVFANTSDNHQRATALLEFCHSMLESGVGFPDLRREFPNSAFSKTTKEFADAVLGLKNKDGHYFVPDKIKKSIVALDTNPSQAQGEWVSLFISINDNALQKRFERYAATATEQKKPDVAAELIKQPNMIYAAFKKIWSSFNLNI